MDKLKMRSADKVAEHIEQIGKLFPNCLTEVKDADGVVRRAIDFDMLRQELSGAVVEGPKERYQFTWPDKRKSVLAANAPIAKTLRPCRAESVNFDATENLYIEGDNLDALKLLQETYLGKVKMIYIDPPYNTGNDFVYEDDFGENAAEYMERSGCYDEDNNRLVQNLMRNPLNNGRFHTDWLNMLYPRLKIARDLLSDDGAIFISMDDHEVHNLRKVLDEIFGAENFIAQINWKGRGGRQDSKYYAVIHEFILCYAKSSSLFVVGEDIKSGDIYPKFDKEKGRFYKTQLLRKWGSNSRKADRPNLFYPIQAPDGSEVYPMLTPITESQRLSFPNTGNEGCWRWSVSTMESAIKEGRVEFIQQKDGSWVPYEKIFAPLKGEEKTKKYTTWIDDVNNGSDTIKELFSTMVFDYPKSPNLISRFLKMGNAEENDIVMDFFSGSATTAHAVMQLNAEDGGHRKFIMVQIPEPTDEKSEAYQSGYPNICEIGKERIRRAGKRIVSESQTGGGACGFGYWFPRPQSGFQQYARRVLYSRRHASGKPSGFGGQYQARPHGGRFALSGYA